MFSTYEIDRIKSKINDLLNKDIAEYVIIERIGIKFIADKKGMITEFSGDYPRNALFYNEAGVLYHDTRCQL